ncbi:MAG: ABC transporter permease, partial [Pseudomonadota bacterium]|nr:ABC transporter permease [Pseudomonadota bacterium]
MVAFIIRRLVQSFVVMFVVALVAFTLFQFVGDPINQLVGVETGLKEREELRQRLGLNDPWIVQFGRFALNAVQFDFGISYQHKRPVIDMIMTRMPATLELSLISALFSLLVGVPMGVYTGLHRDSWLSKLFMTVSLVGISL